MTVGRFGCNVLNRVAKVEPWRMITNGEEFAVGGKKNSAFSLDALYWALKPRGASFFLAPIIWSSLVAAPNGLLSLGGTWSKVLKFDHLKRRGWSVASSCYLCYKEV